MNIKTWLSKLFKGKETINFLEKIEFTDSDKVGLELYSIITVVEYIAAILAKCQIKTIYNGEEFRGLEWYSLNIKPNNNQSAYQFWYEFWCKLLYDKQVLIVPIGKQKIIADSFEMSDDVVKETTFSNVVRGKLTFKKKFKRSDVIYLKYTNQDFDIYLSNIIDVYSKTLINARDKYERSAGERGALEIDSIAKGQNDFNEKYSDLMNNRFRPYFKAKNAVIPLFQGFKYTPTSNAQNNSTEESLDMQRMVNESIKRAAQVYKLNPALIIGEVAGIEDAIDITMSACFTPLISMLKAELNAVEFDMDDIISGKWLIVIDSTQLMHIDVYRWASNIDKIIACGLKSINEVRSDTNCTQINEDWAFKHWLTKNYDDINIVGNSDLGGEIDETQNVGNKEYSAG